MFTEKLSRIFTVVATATLIIAGTSVAFGQTAPPPDTEAVNYFTNAHTGLPDGTVQITNPGTNGGNLCAMIYVFEPDQQLAECCGCNTTPNGLRTLSINSDLTSNPLTPVTITNGVIKIVSSTGSPTCDPRAIKPAAGLRSWGTHILNSGSITETQFLDATLSTIEVTRLTALCKSIYANGSGYGLCTCGTGD